MSGRRKVTLHGGNTIIEANKASKGTVFSRLGADRSGESGRKVRHSSPPRRKPPVVTVPELEPCRMWEKTGDCPYGNNCKNTHPERKKKNFSDPHGGDRVINIDAGAGPGEKPWHKQTTTRTISNDDAGHLRTMSSSDRGRSPSHKRKRYGSGMDDRDGGGGGGLDDGGRRGLADSKLRPSQDGFPEAKRRHRPSYDERLEASGSHVDSTNKPAGADVSKRSSADGMSKRLSTDKPSRRIDHAEHFKGERLERTISTKSHHSDDSGGRMLPDRHASGHAGGGGAPHPYDGFPGGRLGPGSAEASPHRGHSSRMPAGPGPGPGQAYARHPHHPHHAALPSTSSPSSGGGGGHPGHHAGGGGHPGHPGHHAGVRHGPRHDHDHSPHHTPIVNKARSSHAEGSHPGGRGRHAEHLDRGGGARHAGHGHAERDRPADHPPAERARHADHPHAQHRDRHAAASSSSKYVKSPDGRHPQRARPDAGVRDAHARSQDRPPQPGQRHERARADGARDHQPSTLAPMPLSHLATAAAASRTSTASRTSGSNRTSGGSRVSAGSRDMPKTDKRTDYRSRESSASRGSAQRSTSADSGDRHRGGGGSGGKRRAGGDVPQDVPIVIDDATDEDPLSPPVDLTSPQRSNAEDDAAGPASAGAGSVSRSEQESDGDFDDESADLEPIDWSPGVHGSGSEEVMSPQRTDVVYEVSDEVVDDGNEMDPAQALDGFEAEGDGAELLDDEMAGMEASPAARNAAAGAARTSSSESSPRRRVLRAVVVRKLSVQDVHRLVDHRPGQRGGRPVSDGLLADDMSASSASPPPPRNRRAERGEEMAEEEVGDRYSGVLLYENWSDEANDEEVLQLLYADGPVDAGTGVAAAEAGAAAVAAAAAQPGDAGTAVASIADAGDATGSAVAVAADSQVLLYEDMDALSDDEDLNAILQAEGVRSTDSDKARAQLADSDLPVGGASVEDVDWSVLAQESEEGPVTDGAASPDASDACLQRFTAESIFASCGISLQLAGEDVFSAVGALVRDGGGGTASLPLVTAAACGALVQARWERSAASGHRGVATLLRQADGCALTARRDLEIRRQLKLATDSKVMLSQTASAIPGDGAYLRPSLELYHRRSIVTPGGSQPKILPSAVGSLLST